MRPRHRLAAQGEGLDPRVMGRDPAAVQPAQGGVLGFLEGLIAETELGRLGQARALDAGRRVAQEGGKGRRQGIRDKAVAHGPGPQIQPGVGHHLELEGAAQGRMVRILHHDGQGPAQAGGGRDEADLVPGGRPEHGEEGFPALEAPAPYRVRALGRRGREGAFLPAGNLRPVAGDPHLRLEGAGQEQGGDGPGPSAASVRSLPHGHPRQDLFGTGVSIFN